MVIPHIRQIGGRLGETCPNSASVSNFSLGISINSLEISKTRWKLVKLVRN